MGNIILILFRIFINILLLLFRKYLIKPINLFSFRIRYNRLRISDYQFTKKFMVTSC